MTDIVIAGEEALAIAAALNEPKAWLIQRCIDEASKETVHQVLAETLRIERDGGMLRTSEKKRRTPGGVFFYLIKKAVPGPLRRRIFPKHVQRKKSKSSSKTQQGKKPVAMTWEMAEQLVQKIIHSAGGAKTMKLTLIGTPEKIILQDGCTILSMKAGRIPDLPAPLPKPPEGSLLTYAVFVDLRQWRTIPEGSRLLIEGFPIRVNNMDVCLATSVKAIPEKQPKQPKVAA